MASTSEQTFLQAAFSEHCRPDGRTREQYRTINVATGFLAQCNGSARVQIGATDVVVGVKVEIATPSTSHPDCGRLEVHVASSAVADAGNQVHLLMYLNMYVANLCASNACLLLHAYATGSACVRLGADMYSWSQTWTTGTPPQGRGSDVKDAAMAVILTQALEGPPGSKGTGVTDTYRGPCGSCIIHHYHHTQ